MVLILSILRLLVLKRLLLKCEVALYAILKLVASWRIRKYNSFSKIQGVPKSALCVNENNSRNICSSGKKIDIFRNLRRVNFWICSGVNKMSVIGLGGSAQEGPFSTFSHVFLRTFPISQYFPMLNK